MTDMWGLSPIYSVGVAATIGDAQAPSFEKRNNAAGVSPTSNASESDYSGEGSVVGGEALV